MSIETRLRALERRGGDTGPFRFILDTDAAPMTPEEMDAYNRTRKPGEPYRFTICIDRAKDAGLVETEQ